MTQPEAAVAAAASVLTRSKHAWIPATDHEIAADRALAKRMLEAASPHIAAAEHERIRARLAWRWPGTSAEAIEELIADPEGGPADGT